EDENDSTAHSLDEIPSIEESLIEKEAVTNATKSKHVTTEIENPFLTPKTTDFNVYFPRTATVMFDYFAASQDEIQVSKGEKVEIIDDSDPNWCLVKSCRDPTFDGFIPHSYLSFQKNEPLSQELKSSNNVNKHSSKKRSVSSLRTRTPAAVSPIPRGRSVSETFIMQKPIQVKGNNGLLKTFPSLIQQHEIDGKESLRSI
ncbi:hypothetical protein ROZALSC1DRAFT_31342, partial [Rozella allomycis CSF55]